MSRKAWHYLHVALVLTLVLVTKKVVGVTCEFCNKENKELYIFQNTRSVVNKKLHQLQQFN